MIEVKKHGMTIQVGLGTESESPADMTEWPRPPYDRYRIWFKAFGLWTPTVYPGCVYDLAQTLKKSESVESLCAFLISVLAD